MSYLDEEMTPSTTIITKTAKTDYPINELIAKRWSARAFSTRPVEKSKLLSILEAARWAPSSRNEQPWRYIVFTNDNPEKLTKAQSGSKRYQQLCQESTNSNLCDNKENLFRQWKLQQTSHS